MPTQYPDLLAEALGVSKKTGNDTAKIVWTYTDEAPLLATYSLLPIIRTFSEAAGVPIEVRDISVAGRVKAYFSTVLGEDQQQPDDLAEMGAWCKTPLANIIKLPNVSASVPQLIECIEELKAHGYALPEYDPSNEELKAKYGKAIGSAVNPVLREGNSDRRAAASVKEYSMKHAGHPHRIPLMPWKAECKTHVAHMDDKDFFSSEKSFTNEKAESFKIQFVPADGSGVQVMKEGVKLLPGEVVDCTRMNKAALRAFFEKEMQDAKSKDILFSLHLKCTMMKVSDPIMFGHCVEVYYKDVWEKYGALFKELGITSRNGLGDVYSKMKGHAQEKEVLAAIEEVYKTRPRLAMVDSNKGITNLHVPSDVIIDASMPCVYRDGGGMWCPDSAKGARDSKLSDVKCCIPDRCYATFYKAGLDDCRVNGQFDAATMGSVPNVGLMAQKAEEYGSHDKTIEAPGAGKIQVVTADGSVAMEQVVEEGDIFRACQVKDAPIKDWVKLAVSRGKASGWPVVFWLDVNRAHDFEIIKKVKAYLPEFDTEGVDIKILAPVEAMKLSCSRARAGENTISATGNVLRDYLTDLFPILELGTSAKMLSIVPMLDGGGMYETGAGGSAPKHVEQFVDEGHLRWDSLGEFLALACSLEDLGDKTKNSGAKVLGQSLNTATGLWLENARAPERKAGTIDNRGSHYWLCQYWAKAVAEQDSDPVLKAKFGAMYKELCEKEETILSELIACQKQKMDIGGYWEVDPVKAAACMRPSTTLNGIITKYQTTADEHPAFSTPSA